MHMCKQSLITVILRPFTCIFLNELLASDDGRPSPVARQARPSGCLGEAVDPNLPSARLEGHSPPRDWPKSQRTLCCCTISTLTRRQKAECSGAGRPWIERGTMDDQCNRLHRVETQWGRCTLTVVFSA